MTSSPSFSIRVEKTTSPRTKPNETELGFGRFFSDHMFYQEYQGSQKGWSQPIIQAYQGLTLQPGASVLHYGQSLFEGMKAFRGQDGRIRLFRPESNWHRMCVGAERLCLPQPDRTAFLEGLKALVQVDADWIPRKRGTALYLRPTLIGTESFLGVRPAETCLFFIITSPVGSYYGDSLESVKIWIEREYSRASPGGIGAIKAGGNYAASLKAGMEAKKRGYSQVLWTDACEHKYIEEVGTMNVFFVFEDEIVTPALRGSILPGVMRDSVIHVLKHWKKPIVERPIRLEEVQKGVQAGTLKEVFGTGTAAQISPVGALGHEEGEFVIGNGKPGPISNQLFQYFLELNEGTRADEFQWQVLVEENKKAF